MVQKWRAAESFELLKEQTLRASERREKCVASAFLRAPFVFAVPSSPPD